MLPYVLEREVSYVLEKNRYSEYILRNIHIYILLLTFLLRDPGQCAHIHRKVDW